jgi:hypothetical protein
LDEDNREALGQIAYLLIDPEETRIRIVKWLEEGDSARDIPDLEERQIVKSDVESVFSSSEGI